MAEHDERQERMRDLFVAHNRAVLAYAARRTTPPGDIQVAEDVTSTVFVTAWRRLDDLPDDPLPWLLTTARNVLSEHRRSARRRIGYERRSHDDRAMGTPDAPDIGTAVADRIVIQGALAHLSDSDRELATLLAWDDLTLTQAAQVLGVTPAAARTRWKRLRQRLAEYLDEAPATSQALPATHPDRDLPSPTIDTALEVRP